MNKILLLLCVIVTTKIYTSQDAHAKIPRHRRNDASILENPGIAFAKLLLNCRNPNREKELTIYVDGILNIIAMPKTKRKRMGLIRASIAYTEILSDKLARASTTYLKTASASPLIDGSCSANDLAGLDFHVQESTTLDEFHAKLETLQKKLQATLKKYNNREL